MSAVEAAAHTRRRHDANASRRALVQAADVLFDERGYDAATVREIGDRAGVDAALIARYFGGKEGLYLATLQEVARTPLPCQARDIVGHLLSRSEKRGSSPVGLAMVSPTLTDPMREQVRDIIGRGVVQPLVAELHTCGAPDAQLRAEMLVAIAAGLSLTRASGTLPTLAAAPLEQVLAVLAPLVDALHADGVA